MPQVLTLDSPETWTSLASKIFPGANVDRFTELLDLNPSKSVFDSLLAGTQINIPDLSQIAQYAEPVLGQIRSAVAGSDGFAANLASQAKGYVDQFQGYVVQASSFIEGISDSLPPQLKGYASAALHRPNRCLFRGFAGL